MTVLRPRREAFYLPGPLLGGRFCLLTHAPDPVGTLIFVHPFAEEMNKSRRMVALAVEAFASQGWSTLQIDLTGCGDSGGEFGEASWRAWVQDCHDAWVWAAANLPGRLVLWGMRTGALLLADLLCSTEIAAPLLLWQPVGNGRQHLTQFLRLKAAAEMMADADAKSAMDAARSALKAGESVQVAGYALPPAVANGLETASLGLPDAYPAQVVALEVGSEGREDVTPALRILVDRWQSAGIQARAESVAGTAFWQTQEIETSLALIDASVRALETFT
ncbi:MAG: hydrolase 2, exosortase A system-associated [Proteobacteria bacterium]|nr:hydrolase 2, exosortase A system-associated [Pseudomonadota bacterium]